ncbi:hypothetical protein GCM10010495_29240 [Kitasatospora herbaricolor]|uniref:hypothetical protein n=1 Tax=Kitasatospora herbaricolor TaxID=68217 RepID=UPI00174B0AE9|nr:hypothetical protein [Kitasatospora herbaricolor]MDQ0308588.1 hypothetical protein [Kitasatospora herbaricolor]GGV13507.1 hypothetical protein GCM10010495_29240 [Kitasatospora herbaricolor]
MRNGLVQLGAWAAATGAAVALSWLGVHAVLTGAAFEQPTALPLPSPAAKDVAESESATRPPSASRVESTPEAALGTATQRAAAPSTPPPSPPPAPAPSTAPAARKTAATSVRSFLVPGGRVALDLRPTSAELVSATPDPGWQMQVWHGDQWMRIDFSKGGDANSVFVTWNGHEPDVQTVVR